MIIINGNGNGNGKSVGTRKCHKKTINQPVSSINHLSVDLQERVWLAISKEKIPVFSMHFGFFSCPELKNHGLLSWNKTSIVASRESF